MGVPPLQTFQQPGPLDQANKALQFRTMMGNQQLQQQQVAEGDIALQQKQQDMKDQQTIRQLFIQNQGDMDKTLNDAISAGVKPQTIQQIKSGIIEQKTKLATLDKTTLEGIQKRTEIYGQTTGSILALPPEQRKQAAAQALPGLVQQGVVKPEEAQGLMQQLPQMDDQALEQFLKLHQYSAMATDKQVKEIRDNQSQAAKLPGEQAESDIKVRSNAAAQLGAATTKEQYAQLWGELPAKVARQFPQPEQWTPDAKDTILQAGMTPHEQATVPMEKMAYKDWAQQQKSAGKPSGPSDYTIAMKKLVPAFNFNLQNGGGTGGGAPIPTTNQDGTPKSYDDMLKSFGPKGGTVRAVLEGRQSAPSGFALKTPYWQDVMNKVYAVDPQWSEQRAQLRKAYTVGPQSKEINAINTAMGHVGVMGEAIDALDNGNIKVLNSIANRLGVEVGNDAVTTFNTIVHRVGPELSKAYVGAGGSAGERGADEKDFDTSLGTKQLKSNVGITAQLLRSKISSLENQWDQNRSPNMPSFQDRFIMPEASKQLNKWNPQSGGNQGGGKGGGQLSVSAGGKTYTFKDQQSLDNFKRDAGIK